MAGDLRLVLPKQLCAAVGGRATVDGIRFGAVGSLDLEAEYNNRRRVREVDAIAARWQASSDAYRESARAELDQSYGPGERHLYDIYFGGPGGRPTVVYIHGGYWQWGDRRMYAFVARALNAHGVNVVLPSYSLCPVVSVMDIVEDLRLCLAAVWERTRIYPLVVGHSAGGHLTAAMLSTDWSTVAGVPRDLVRAGIAISGIFDLQPLIATSINDAVGLDRESARAASPLFWAAPPGGGTLVAAVGAEESSEFLRQSREIVEHWGRAGVRTACFEIPGVNHFTVIEELTVPNTGLFARVLSLARQIRGTGHKADS